MKPYRELTRLGRLRRARRLAETALRAYDLPDARLTFLRYFANITYRVDLPGAAAPGSGPYLPGRYLLRVLLSGDEAIARGEMTWLRALSQEAGLAVPAPLPARDGELLRRVEAPGVPGGRLVSLMRWIDGRSLKGVPDAGQMRAWGDMLGRLHAFAAGWQPPAGFQRFVWDWDGLLGGRGFHNPVDELVETMPEPLREPFQTVSRQARGVMAALGRGPDAFGMLHGDMFPENLLFKDGRAYPIDFEDCGFGPWLWDVGVAVCIQPWTDAGRRLQDAFLEGYLRVHALGEAQLRHLDLFMAVNYATGVLWASQFLLNEPARKAEHAAWRDENGAPLLRYFETH